MRKRFCPGFFSLDQTPAFKGSGFSACGVFTGCCRQTHRTLQSKSPWRSTKCPTHAPNEAAFDRTNGSTAPAHGAARPDRAALPRAGGQGALNLPGGSRRQKRRAWPRIDFRKTRPSKPYRKAGMSNIRDATGAPWTSPRLPSGRPRKAPARASLLLESPTARHAGRLQAPRFPRAPRARSLPWRCA